MIGRTVQILLAQQFFQSLKPKGVLEFRGYFGVLGTEAESAHWVLYPALIEYKEEVATRLQRPSNAALPPEVVGSVVVLE